MSEGSIICLKGCCFEVVLKCQLFTISDLQTKTCVNSVDLEETAHSKMTLIRIYTVYRSVFDCGMKPKLTSVDKPDKRM